MNKRDLRSHGKSIRSLIPYKQVIENSKAILNFLFRHRWYKECRTIFTYVSTEHEVQTHSLIHKALNDDKVVCVPKVIPGKYMVAVRINNIYDDVEPGFFNILEPKSDLPLVFEKDIDLVIVPGLLFDRKGYRIGYGGGYYDRYLQKLPPSCKTIGLAYNAQVVDNLPHEPHDINVMQIITEKGIIRC